MVLRVYFSYIVISNCFECKGMRANTSKSQLMGLRCEYEHERLSVVWWFFLYPSCHQISAGMGSCANTLFQMLGQELILGDSLKAHKIQHFFYSTAAFCSASARLQALWRGSLFVNKAVQSVELISQLCYTFHQYDLCDCTNEPRQYAAIEIN